MRYKIRNFKHEEFRCPDCGKIQIALPLVFWLDVIRDACNYPLVITSGYRCKERNAKVGGAPMSRHLIGCAVDVAIPKGLKYETLAAFFKRFTREGFELKLYDDKSHIHFATPRDTVRHLWNGESEVTV
jgi:uncharacterized protein YcbK (DUF882 family)